MKSLTNEIHWIGIKKAASDIPVQHREIQKQRTKTKLYMTRARISRHLLNHFAKGGKLEEQIEICFRGSRAWETNFNLPKNAENGMNAENRV